MMRLGGAGALAAALTLLACSGASGIAEETDESTEALSGIWASAEVYEHALRGDLTVRQDGTAWVAEISGEMTSFTIEGGRVAFQFDAGQGGFRGHLEDDAATIRGFWLQPPGGTVDGQDPGGLAQPFASPLELVRQQDGTWSGDVVPLDDHFTLYLDILENDNGLLVGAFRNPELNAIGGASRFIVDRNGNDVRFHLTTSDDEELVHDAVLSDDGTRMNLFWPEAERNVELVRVEPEEVPDYFPRPPGTPPYAYQVPLDTGDGWSTASASAEGFDETVLTEIIQGIIDGNPAGPRPNLIHSILIARHGELVLEEYFFGHDRETPHDLRSAGKTFASVLLGAAMLEGYDIDPQSHIVDFFEDEEPFANPDPRKQTITLAHLMTHTSGLACDDADEASPGNELNMQMQTDQPDWWRHTLDLPQMHEPGTLYAYCSANTNLVGGALTRATGTWLPEFFNVHVAEPLGFGRYYWNLTPTGDGYLGGGAFLRPRDLLRVGQSYLDGGVWQGRRIVDAEWIEASTEPFIAISPETTGLTDEAFSYFYTESAEGYAWHLHELQVGERTYRSYEAIGNGGQLLMVIPELDMVVVFMGGNYLQGGIWLRWRTDIIGATVIPSLD